MASAIYMPKAGMAMEEGTLIRWLKHVGDSVECNEPIMEIETDKITMEAEAPASGVLLATLAQEGDVVPVLQTIGWIGQAGEEIPVESQDGVMAQASREQAAQAAQLATTLALSHAHGIAATPYAKTLMRKHSIGAEAISPSGKHGEIIAADVAAKLAAQGATRVRLSGMRKVIAGRMLKSCQEIPAVTQNTAVDVSELLRLRARLNEGRAQDTRVTINDFILRAVALASVEFSAFRTQLEDDALVTYPHVHIGMAVDTDNGLLVPVLRDANLLSLFRLSAQAKDLAARARENRLLPDETAGSTLTVSNLGMYEVESFSPIINQPNSAIVGVCNIRDELALKEDGTVYAKKMLRLSVTLDHRIIDGAVGARFALHVKNLLENPLELLL